NVLTGKNLDDILAERTGISGMNVIPVSSANKPSDTEKDKDKTDKDKTDKDETDKDKTDKDKTDKDETDKGKTDKDNTDKSPENPSVDTAVEASGANAVSEKKPYEPKYSLETLGSSGAENISYWKTKNSDVIGWLRIPNTNIDFPVVVGPDSLYYNERGYGKETSKNGVIWADSATNFGTRSQISQNTVLYGHNWTNYSPKPHIGRPQDIMFAQLTSFHHLDFAKNTPYIYYSTESEEMVWKVFASLYTETKWNYLEADAGSAYMQSLISKAKTKSMHNYNVDVNANDKILTLSTCTRAYGQRNDQRFVVMARLVRKGEAIDEVSVTENPNFETPQF
ncbi:MAG: class B sortase, partial [Oscillospiraceae bacterium]